MFSRIFKRISNSREFVHFFEIIEFDLSAAWGVLVLQATYLTAAIPYKAQGRTGRGSRFVRGLCCAVY